MAKPTIIDQLRQAVRKAPSQYAIARELGIDQGNLNAFANGRRSLSLETAALLCSHLGLRLTGRR